MTTGKAANGPPAPAPELTLEQLRWLSQCLPIFVQPEIDIRNGHPLVKVYAKFDTEAETGDYCCYLYVVFEGEGSYQRSRPTSMNHVATFFYRTHNRRVYGRTADINYLIFKGVDLSYATPAAASAAREILALHPPRQAVQHASSSASMAATTGDSTSTTTGVTGGKTTPGRGSATSAPADAPRRDAASPTGGRDGRSAAVGMDGKDGKDGTNGKDRDSSCMMTEGETDAPGGARDAGPAGGSPPSSHGMQRARVGLNDGASPMAESDRGSNGATCQDDRDGNALICQGDRGANAGPSEAVGAAACLGRGLNTPMGDATFSQGGALESRREMVEAGDMAAAVAKADTSVLEHGGIFMTHSSAQPAGACDGVVGSIAGPAIGVHGRVVRACSCAVESCVCIVGACACMLKVTEGVPGGSAQSHPASSPPALEASVATDHPLNQVVASAVPEHGAVLPISPALEMAALGTAAPDSAWMTQQSADLDNDSLAPRVNLQPAGGGHNDSIMMPPSGTTVTPPIDASGTIVTTPLDADGAAVTPPLDADGATVTPPLEADGPTVTPHSGPVSSASLPGHASTGNPAPLGEVEGPVSSPRVPWRELFSRDSAGEQTWSQGDRGNLGSWVSLYKHYRRSVPYAEWDKDGHRPRVYLNTSNHLMGEKDNNPGIQPKYEWREYAVESGDFHRARWFARTHVKAKANLYSWMVFCVSPSLWRGGKKALKAQRAGAEYPLHLLWEQQQEQQQQQQQEQHTLGQQQGHNHGDSEEPREEEEDAHEEYMEQERAGAA
eukprot:jgi/Mesvir1/15240/Mv06465-RA.1